MLSILFEKIFTQKPFSIALINQTHSSHFTKVPYTDQANINQFMMEDEFQDFTEIEQITPVTVVGRQFKALEVRTFSKEKI